jgi:hypothetical protein
MVIASGLGIKAVLPAAQLAPAQLFGEIQGDVVVSSSNLGKVKELSEQADLLVFPLGTTTAGATLNLTGLFGELSWNLTELTSAYESAIPRLMGAADLA